MVTNDFRIVSRQRDIEWQKYKRRQWARMFAAFGIFIAFVVIIIMLII